MELEKKNDKIPFLQEGGIVTKDFLHLLERDDHEIPLPIGYEGENNKTLELILEEIKTWGIKRR